MPRPSLSVHTFAPVLAVFFALSAIVLVVTSRDQAPPRLTDLAVLETTVRSTSSSTLRVMVDGKEMTVDTGTCAPMLGAVKAGDIITVWVDKASRVWRVTQLTRPICTFAQSTVADASGRTTRRRVAMGFAVVSAVCVAVMIVGTRRVELIDDTSTA